MPMAMPMSPDRMGGVGGKVRDKRHVLSLTALKQLTFANFIKTYEQ